MCSGVTPEERKCYHLMESNAYNYLKFVVGVCWCCCCGVLFCFIFVLLFSFQLPFYSDFLSFLSFLSGEELSLLLLIFKQLEKHGRILV